jgi:hypothetical protein
MGALFITLVFRSGNLAPGGTLNDAPAEALVAGVTGTYRIAALIILGATLLAGVALWTEKRRKTRPHRHPVKTSSSGRG